MGSRISMTSLTLETGPRPVFDAPVVSLPPFLREEGAHAIHSFLSFSSLLISVSSRNRRNRTPGITIGVKFICSL